jgi:hypothetical protein
MQNDTLEILLGQTREVKKFGREVFWHNSVKARLSRAITERLTIFWWSLLFWTAILLYSLVYGFRLMFFWLNRLRYARSAEVGFGALDSMGA